jgi:O-antigen/teichoic acid export membrane protein
MFSINKNKLAFLFGSTAYVAIIQFSQILFSGYYFSFEQLGNLATIQLILNFAIAFSDAGVLNLIIQRRKLSEKFLNELSIFLIFFMALYSLTYIAIINYIDCNYLIFNDINISLIFLVPGIIISMLITYKYNYLMRFSDFKDTSNIDILAVSAQMSFFILFVFLGFGVESIIYSWYISISMKYFLLHNKVKKRNLQHQFKFKLINKKFLKFLLHYQFYQFLERLINMFSTQLDIIIVSGLFGKEVLGAYSFLKTISLKGIQLLSMLFHKILFPSLAALKRKNGEKFEESTNSMILFMHIGILFTGLNFLFSFIVMALYGEKFTDFSYLIYYLQFQAFYIFLVTLNTSFLLANNKVKSIVLLNIIGGFSISLSYLFLLNFDSNLEELIFLNLLFEYIFLTIYLKFKKVKFDVLFLIVIFALMVIYFKVYLLFYLLFLTIVFNSIYIVYVKRDKLLRYFNYE